MPFPIFSVGLLAFVSLLLSGAALASESDPMTYDRISFAVSVQQEVEADELTALLAAQREGSDAAALAGEVNSLVDWALKQAQAEAEVSSETLGYASNPVYSKGTLTGWRVSQSIRLRSTNSAALSDLVGRLQQRLLLQSIGYEISDARRKEAETELIKSGIEAFKTRAQLIADQMGERPHRLVEMRVDTEGGHPIPIFRSAPAMVAAEAAPAPPRIEAGTQTIRVSISGVIELQVQ
jgi:predicted secreted protein